MGDDVVDLLIGEHARETGHEGTRATLLHDRAEGFGGATLPELAVAEICATAREHWRWKTSSRSAPPVVRWNAADGTPRAARRRSARSQKGHVLVLYTSTETTSRRLDSRRRTTKTRALTGGEPADTV